MSSIPPPLPLDLALQGGGSHGAFTWGVLDRLLEDPGIEISGISGTSAGAINAVAMASGWVSGGRDGARQCLHNLWMAVADSAPFSAALTAGLTSGSPWVDEWASGLMTTWGRSAAQSISPYLFNPLNLNPLQKILRAQVDFEQVRRCESLKLFIATTRVYTGELRVFEREELTEEVVLASACLPMLFQAVEIDGEPYWDGGYAGNPSLMPLIQGTPAHDLLLVQINPSLRPEWPKQAQDIVDRISEITFNASLLKELRLIHQLKGLIDDRDSLLDDLLPRKDRVSHLRRLLGASTADKTRDSIDCADPDRREFFRRVESLRIHRVEGGEALLKLGAASKLKTSKLFLLELFEEGRAAANRWLELHRDALGKRSTFDLQAACGQL